QGRPGVVAGVRTGRIPGQHGRHLAGGGLGPVRHLGGRVRLRPRVVGRAEAGGRRRSAPGVVSRRVVPAGGGTGAGTGRVSRSRVGGGGEEPYAAIGLGRGIGGLVGEHPSGHGRHLAGAPGLLGAKDLHPPGAAALGVLPVVVHGQTSRSSFSLWERSWSIAATWAWVIFSMSFSTRSSSSDDMDPSFSRPSSSCRLARRRLRMATFPSSALCRTTLTSSFRRSSVSGGKERRMTVPSLAGLMPRSEVKMAFSTADSELLSYGVMTSSMASGTLNPASCFSGVWVP